MGTWVRDDVTAAFGELIAEQARARASGESAIGWKLGLGSEAAMTTAGIDAPLVGYLLESGRLASGATVDVAGWAAPKLEPEIAVYLGRDLGGEESDAEIVAAIDAVSLAFELVDASGPLSDAVGVVAANVFQRAVLLGERMPATLSPGPVSVLVDGVEVAAVADPASVVGDYPVLVRHVAAVLGAHGESVRAGQVIITGMVTPAIPLTSGAYRMTGEGLGEITLTVA